MSNDNYIWKESQTYFFNTKWLVHLFSFNNYFFLVKLFHFKKTQVTESVLQDANNPIELSDKDIKTLL